MIDPELYFSANSIQKRDAKDLLINYIHLVKWSTDGDDVVMDIGCGPGDVTYHILKPKLPKNSRLIGADVSESMVQFSKMKYPDIEFVNIDIGAFEIPNNWKEKIHHIFSFYCLNWIIDQKQAFKNLYDLLKPGGDILVCYLGNHPIFDIYLNMAKKTLWKPYMMDINKYLSPYHNYEDVEESLKEILLDVGFEISVCEYKTQSCEYENINTFLKEMYAANPCFKNIPDKMKEQFKSDYIKEIRKMKIIKENHEKNGQISFSYNLITICASKPLK